MKTFFLIITVAYFQAVSWQGSTPTTYAPLRHRVEIRQSENYQAFLFEYNTAMQQLNQPQPDSAEFRWIEAVDTTSVVNN